MNDVINSECMGDSLEMKRNHSFCFGMNATMENRQGLSWMVSSSTRFTY